MFRSKTVSVHPPVPLNPSCRPHAYGLWKPENMEKGVAAVEKGMSIRLAAELHGIPKSTLYDHVSGRVELYAKAGPSPYLTAEEEEELANFLVQCSPIGYPHTRMQVLGIVQEILTSKNMKVAVTNGWWERFRQRHPYLALRTSVPLSYVRAKAEDPKSISRYFDLLEDTLKRNDLFDKLTTEDWCKSQGSLCCW